MRIFMVTFVPTRVRRLKTGGALVLPVSFHTTRAKADAALRKYMVEFPNKEGYYAVEPWSVVS